MSARGPVRVLLGAVTAMALLGAGWFAATQVVSPAQVAARAEPPTPEPVVAPLRRGYLHGSMSFAVDAVAAGVVDVQAPKTLDGVVTASDLAVGAEVLSGTAVLRVNGRPIIVLTGPFALYRDLTLGDSGDDVVMLQHALVDAGHLRATPDGRFGPRTAAAVRALYRSVGFDAPSMVPDPPATPAVAVGEDGQPIDATPSRPRPQTMVSAAELVFTRTLPAVMASVAQVGDVVEAGTSLVTVANGAPELQVTTPPESIGPLVVGATGSLTVGGQAATASVTAIEPTADGQSLVRWTVDGAVTVGTQHVVTVDNPAAQESAQLLAPVTAITSRGGVDVVTVRDGDVFREVTVEVLGTLGAVAAIRPVDPGGRLEEGTEVRLA